jgi:hypothetical protein
MKAFLFLISFLLILSCNKLKSERKSEVTFVDEITYNSATIHTESSTYKKDNLYTGIIYGIADKPDSIIKISDEIQIKYQKEPIEEFFMINHLIGNKKYYIKSFLRLNNTEYLYSEPYYFTTKDIPAPPCSFTPGVLDFEYFTNTMTDVVEKDFNSFGYNLYPYETVGNFGVLRMFFNHPPTTGIYKTSIYHDVQLDNEIGIYFKETGGYNLIYQVELDKEVFVHVSDDNHFRISFCPLIFGNSTGLGASTYTISGEVHN